MACQLGCRKPGGQSASEQTDLAAEVAPETARKDAGAFTFGTIGSERNFKGGLEVRFGRARVFRSCWRFSDRGTEYFNEYSIRMANDGANRQCDRTLRSKS